MPVSLEDFLDSPDKGTFETLKKDELLALGVHFKLSVKSNMKKDEIKIIVAKKLVDEKMFDEYDFSQNKNDSDKVEMRKLELQYELELRKLEFEDREKERQLQREREENDRKMQLELEKIKSEQSLESSKKLEVSPESKDFDAAKNIRLVPKFVEKSVEKYFPQFEKVADNLKWPRSVWSILLQSVLVGKAAEVYSALSVADSSDYDKVKTAILKAYELVPEAYRQKFRSYTKYDNQTFVEFARDKEDLFDQWLRSQKINSVFENLRQLILLEEFKQSVGETLRVHLDEKGVKTLTEAAIMSDTYALTHRTCFLQPSESSFSQPPVQTSSRPHVCPTSSPTAGRSDYTQGQGSLPTCAYCKKKGHLIGDCFKLKKKRDLESLQPHGCAAVKGDKSKLASPCSNIPDVQGRPNTNQNSMKDYKPFLSQGFVSIGESGNSIPVQILRDTGAAQTLLLEGVLPLSEETSAGGSVLLQGVGPDIIDVPLHRIFLKSSLVTGPVVVGVRPTFPMQGISVLLGNDLAGGKVVADPIVCEKVIDAGEEENQELFPACAITRAMKRKEEAVIERTPVQKSNNFLDDDTFVLYDTFLAHCENDYLDLTFPTTSKLKSTSSQETKCHVPLSDETAQTPFKADKDIISREQLLTEQLKDADILQLSQRALPPEEASKVRECFYHQDGILMRKWRPRDASQNEEWSLVHQIVMPQVYRRDVLSIAHDTPMAGHMGVNKTYNRILSHFFWPKLRRDVSEFCKSCHVCQVVGKPNQQIPIAPLQPIPAFEEPFSRVLVDCVGPLPKSKTGNEYLLTVMCTSTRFPEAIPLRNIKAKTIVKALTKFFSFVGTQRRFSPTKDQILCLGCSNKSCSSLESNSTDLVRITPNLREH